jgi:hypothetical protein
VTHKIEPLVSLVQLVVLFNYYYNYFKIYPRITGQAGNFHSYGSVICDKSGDVIILQIHMHVCNTHLQCFQLLF